MNSKESNHLGILLIVIVFLVTNILVYAQSIGYHPQVNFGFNPYLSPVYGYGLGLQFGANNFSPVRSPYLANSVFGPHFGTGYGLMGKVHAKSFFKKLATSQYSLYPHYGTLKEKFKFMKHPESVLTPYGLAYGYGRHYGAAMIPNNPYKSVYADYYDFNKPIRSVDSASGLVEQASNVVAHQKPHGLIKPLIKAGALLTTAALLGKKAPM